MMFHNAEKRDKHSAIHKGVTKQHLCTECGKDFAWLSSLQVHMSMHTKEIWWKPSLTMVRFGSVRYLSLLLLLLLDNVPTL